jgi:hypothetical protein
MSLGPRSDTVLSKLSALLGRDCSISRAAKVFDVVWLKRSTICRKKSTGDICHLHECSRACIASSSCVFKSQHESKTVIWDSRYNCSMPRIGLERSESFTQLFQQFPGHVKSKKNLWIQDRHNSHTKHTQLLHLSQENGVISCGCQRTAQRKRSG